MRIFCLAIAGYSRISVMTPAPTVRPPSRMANFDPFSSATFEISSPATVPVCPRPTPPPPPPRPPPLDREPVLHRHHERLVQLPHRLRDVLVHHPQQLLDRCVLRRS